MPTLRILGDGRAMFATPGFTDAWGYASFDVGGGDAVEMVIDYTAWLMGEALSSSTWTAHNATASGDATASGVASVMLDIPASPSSPEILAAPIITVLNVAVCADGRRRRSIVRLYPQPTDIPG